MDDKPAINVLFDISALGRGFGHGGNQRTGLFRVVEELALGLSKTMGDQLTFCSSSLKNAHYCRDYLRTMPALSGMRFCGPRWQSAVYRELSARQGSLAGKSLHPLARNVLEKPLIWGRHALESATRSVDSAPLAAAQLYHSPLDVFPREVRAAGHLRRLMLIYDLIPITHPQFVTSDKYVGPVLRDWRRDDWCHAISQATKDVLCEHLGNRIDPARVFVTHLAASPQTFHPVTDPEALAAARKRYGLPDSPYVLSLCTLEPRKNIDHVVRCFARLVQQERLTDLYLVLVGSKGWMFDGIFRAIEEAGGRRDRIVTTGFVPDEDLAAIYSGALCFAYMSVCEGFGLPPLEAMQCGVPAITSNNTSLPEVMGDAGIMLDPMDADGLSAAILQLYRDRALREELAQRAVRRAAMFSWERCVRETQAVYRHALANP